MNLRFVMIVWKWIGIAFDEDLWLTVSDWVFQLLLLLVDCQIIDACFSLFLPLPFASLFLNDLRKYVGHSFFSCRRLFSFILFDDSLVWFFLCFGDDSASKIRVWPVKTEEGKRTTRVAPSLLDRRTNKKRRKNLIHDDDNRFGDKRMRKTKK